MRRPNCSVKMFMKSVIIFACTISAVISKPIENFEGNAENLVSRLNFITNSIFSSGSMDKYIRSKRSVAAECEELELCRLHAQSGHSFMAAFQLYFVNKENARLWDHKQHSMSECDRLHERCVNGAEPETPRKSRKTRPTDYRAADDGDFVSGDDVDVEDNGDEYE